MKQILTRCGYRCDLCLAYRDNIKNNDRRKELSDGWHKYFGFRIEPEKIYCDGCTADDCINPSLLEKDCSIRQCVIEKKFNNCSECDDYICDKLKQRIGEYNCFNKYKKEEIPADEFELFIKPYLSKERLDKLRKNNT